MSLHTQRTMAAKRKDGFKCGVVERWIKIPGIPGGGKRMDLFKIIDVIAIKPGCGITGIQCCAGSGFANHFNKITVEQKENTKDWLEANGKLELWGWRKLKLKRGGKAIRWRPRVQEITWEMLGESNDPKKEE